MTRAVSGPKEIKINRPEDLADITTRLLTRPTSRPRTGKDVQLIFKKLNNLIDEVSDRFSNAYTKYRYFKMAELDKILKKLDPNKLVVLVVD
jgi:hypothetical protein